MRFLIDYLSGNVPGGFLALFFLLFTVNVALFYLFKSSKLFDETVYKKKVLRYNLLILSLYVFLWFYLRPPGLPDTIIFAPFQAGDAVDILYPELLQEHLSDRLADGHRLYRWDWLYKTANPDSFNLEDYRSQLMRELGLSVIFSGKILENTPSGYVIECTLWENGTNLLTEKITATTAVTAVRQMIRLLSSESGIIERNRVTVIEGDDAYWGHGRPELRNG